MAKNFPLNLSKFKKIREDADMAVLSHPDGHQITIAKKPLSPKLRGQIAQLAMADDGEMGDKNAMKYDDGGEVSKPTPKPSTVDKGWTQSEKQDFAKGAKSSDVSIGKAWENAKKSLGFAEGGEIDEGEIKKPDDDDKGIGSLIQTAVKLAPLLAASGGEVANKKENYDDESIGEIINYPGSVPSPKPSPKEPKAKYADGTPDSPVSQNDVLESALNKEALQASQVPPVNQEASLMEQNQQEAPANAPAPPAKEQAQNPEPPTGPNAQYAGLYQNELNQISTNNPGLPPTIQQQMALDAAMRDKGALKTEDQQAKSAAVNAYNSAMVINQKRQELGLPPMPVPANPEDQRQQAPVGNLYQSSDAATASTSQQLPTSTDPYGMNASYDMWMKGMNQRLGGIWKEAAAAGQLGTNQAQILDSQIKNQQQFQQYTKEQYDSLNQERRHVLDDLDNSHIDANKYVSNMSTGDKVKTTIGLILGGFGALAGQENLAYKTLQANISRDIEAQKDNMGKKVTLLSNNMAQFGNLRDALQMSHVQSQDIIAHQLQREAAAMAPGLAQSRAAQLAGQLQQDSANMVAQMGMRRSLMGLTAGSQDPRQFGSYLQMLRVMNPEMAKEMESRYIPNVGVAQVPVPQAVRDNILAKQQLDARARDLYQWSSQHSGSLSPTDINVGKAKAAELQSMYRNAINGGVFKKGEQEFIDNIITSDPTAFFNKIRVLPQLRTVIGSNAAQLGQLKQSVGLPGAKGSDEFGAFTPKTFKKIQK